MISPDSSSRRAFALDSRTVWVEQQLRHNVILAKDNLPLGPGEYTPKILERHVYTPALGKFRTPADHFRSFSSDLRTRTPLNGTRSEVDDRKIPNPTGGSEFTTIFHDHDKREGIDPHKRFCETPGSYLTHDPILRTLNHDGVKTVPSAVFGPEVEERIQYFMSPPSYDVNYDSKHIRHMPKLGCFDKEKRVIKLGQKCYYDQAPAPPPEERPVSPYRLKKEKEKEQLEGHKTLFQQRCELVPLPKLKVRHPEVLTFNASSYKVPRWEGPVSLTPKRINQVAGVHLYDKVLAIPRKHKSTGYTKPSGSTI